MKSRILIFGLAVLALTTADLLAQSLNVFYSFTTVDSTLQTNQDGAVPQASLLLSGNMLYGAALFGGTNGAGTVFSIDTTVSNFNVLHTFAPTNGSPMTNADGIQPVSQLILSGNTLYGSTFAGGLFGSGTIFSLGANGSNFTLLHTFAPAVGPAGTNADGSGPAGNLVLASNILYGTAFSGGTNGAGTIFSINTLNSNFIVLNTFAPLGNIAPYTNAQGAYPQAGLVLSGGTLFGTTTAGATNGNGSVFSLDTGGGNFNVLHTFGPTAGPLATNADGAGLYENLLLSGGTLYGAAYAGGTNGNGTVFSIGSNGSNFMVLYTFSAVSGSPATNAEGANPFSGPALVGGTLYGTATSGGANGNGTVFSMSTNGAGPTVLYTFSATSGATATNLDGASPWAGVSESGNALYGATVLGGGGNGTAYRLQLAPSRITGIAIATNKNATLHFSGSPNGTYLVQASTNPASPAAWQIFSTNLADTNGLWSLTDTNASLFHARFYRAATQ